MNDNESEMIIKDNLSFSNINSSYNSIMQMNNKLLNENFSFNNSKFILLT
jgi:hypothetical protein